MDGIDRDTHIVRLERFRGGDRGGAVREYEAFAARLRRELDVEPAPETRALIERVRARTEEEAAASAAAPIAGASALLVGAEPARPPEPEIGNNGPRVIEPATPASRSPRRNPARRRTPVALILGLVAVVAGAWGIGAFRHRGGTAPHLDPDLVAVTPFRVSGADASLGFLHEGMLDLLSAKLTGEVGPRAADPRTVLSGWRSETGSGGADDTRDAAIEVAWRIGAGQLVLGEVVGAPDHLVLQASLVALPDGRTRARASVEGPPTA